MKSLEAESRPFQSRFKGEVKFPAGLLAKRTAEAFQIETDVPNWFRRRTFHVLDWLCIRFGSWKIRRLNRVFLEREFVF